MYDITFGGGWAGGTSGGGGSTTSPTYSGPNYMDILNFALQGYQAYSNNQNTKKTNEQNAALSRENMMWQERMSNTAVQRRKADIIAAGGNPATAFVTGGEATTPSVQTARMEAPRFDAPRLNSANALIRAQLANTNADTLAKAATARSLSVQADIDEASKESTTNYKINHNLEGYEWDDLKTKILRNQETSTAAQARKMDETVEALIARAKQDAAKGQLDLEALRNIAEVGGIEMGKMQGIIKLLISVLRD